MSKLNKALLALLVVSSTCFADAPYINNNTASDSERVSDGEITCDTSKAKATINSGVFQDKDKGAYVGISIPLGGGKEIDCSKLYDQVLKKNELKIKQLEMQVALLEKRQLNVKSKETK